MTDEEKAEEYLDKKYLKDMGIREPVKKALLYGLAEGRKEGYEQGKNNERESQCGKKNYEKDISKLEKENAEQKAQISILLSCKECPENKGGYVCEKEYNDKCLAQKIEYIKELKEENEDLRNFAEKLSENHANEWQEQQQVITELRNKLDKVSEWVKEQEYPDGCIDCSCSDTEKLKEILK